MTAILKNPRRSLYLCACMIAIGIYSWQRLEMPIIGWVNNYVNDFLCLPLVLGCITQLVRWVKKDAHFHFPLLFILALATYYSIFFEVYLPASMERYTADWIDVGLYFLGGFCYYGISRYKGMLARA